jgi:hypothetical protein
MDHAPPERLVSTESRGGKVLQLTPPRSAWSIVVADIPNSKLEIPDSRFL